MIGESTKHQLSDRVFVDVGTDGHAAVILTTEQDGRTTNRIVLSLAAARALYTFLGGLQFSRLERVVESTKKLGA
jgi:hypothetical protein